MRSAFLVLPARTPAHRDELKRVFAEALGGARPPTTLSHIDPTLGRPVRDGFVQCVRIAQERRPDKRAHELTADGPPELDQRIVTPSIQPGRSRRMGSPMGLRVIVRAGLALLYLAACLAALSLLAGIWT